MTKRILVTGSRDWEDIGRLAFFLGEAIGAYSMVDDVVVVHGHCPRGADAMADRLCRVYDIPVERHPADWNTYGPKAGFIRNSEMVALGADVCLAFIRNDSRGARMTADLAEASGIRTVRFLA